MIGRVASWLIVACAVGGGCIVTDEIEFEDYVNNPPEVVEVDPDNQIIQSWCKASYSFTVVVWDPDEADAYSYAARLSMWIEPHSPSNPVSKECVVTELATAGEQLEEYKTGVQLNVACTIELQQYQGLQEDTLLLFEVQVSDQGYNQSALPAGARTAEVVWVGRVETDPWICGG